MRISNLDTICFFLLPLHTASAPFAPCFADPETRKCVSLFSLQCLCSCNAAGMQRHIPVFSAAAGADMYAGVTRTEGRDG